MMNFFKRHNHPTDHPQAPFFTEVEAAPLPNEEVAAETKAVQIELVQTVLLAARQGAEIRSALARNTLRRLDRGYNAS